MANLKLSPETLMLNTFALHNRLFPDTTRKDTEYILWTSHKSNNSFTSVKQNNPCYKWCGNHYPPVKMFCTFDTPKQTVKKMFKNYLCVSLKTSWPPLVPAQLTIFGNNISFFWYKTFSLSCFVLSEKPKEFQKCHVNCDLSSACVSFTIFLSVSDWK